MKEALGRLFAALALAGGTLTLPASASAQPVWHVEGKGTHLTIVGTKVFGRASETLPAVVLTELRNADVLLLELEPTPTASAATSTPTAEEPPAPQAPPAAFLAELIGQCARWDPQAAAADIGLNRPSDAALPLLVQAACCTEAYAADQGRLVDFGTEARMVQAFRGMGKTAVRGLETRDSGLTHLSSIPAREVLQAVTRHWPSTASTARDIADADLALASASDSDLETFALAQETHRDETPYWATLDDSRSTMTLARMIDTSERSTHLVVAMDVVRLFGTRGLLRMFRELGFTVRRVPGAPASVP